MKTLSKVKNSISRVTSRLFRYELQKKVAFKSNKYLGICFVIYCILIWILITCWILYNKGHIKVNSNIHSTIVLSIKGGFKTNYSKEEFNETYVKPHEYQNYNRVWDFPDFVFKSSREIEVMTNVVITANQTQTTCPETGQLFGYMCDPNNNNCTKGKNSPHGELTGRCIEADFPHSFNGVWRNVSTCEIIGWCPVDRCLIPLKNKAVLIETKNTTLWMYNTVEFPEFNLILDNSDGKNTNELINCTYNPLRNPRCPVFRLGDLIKYTANVGQTYEEIAIHGAVINININYSCFVNSFFRNPENNCNPSYSFRRVDTEKKLPVMGYTSYRFAHYFNGGKSRNFFRSYRIRFVVIVNAKVQKYDFFEFVTKMCAYDSVFAISLFIFAAFVKILYRKSDIVETM